MTPAKKVADIGDVATDNWVMYDHPLYRGIELKKEYFYDGEVTVHYGRVEIPRGRNEWAQRLLYLGYTWENDVVPGDFEYVR